ncbi:MAG TPA: BamA/TamA family outer membrane protein [Noviherbaspirillum sp.]|nr:BamA/TamA family outer membrane protein [Noviherbaspirillum sp.]
MLTPLRRLRLRALLFLLCLLAGPAAVAQQSPAYVVAIDGAGPYWALLSEHLDIVRRQDDTGLTEAEIVRRVGVTPRQIRDLLATEGFFSVDVRHALDRSTTPWTARFELSLGPPAIVESAEIRFQGAIAEGPAADPERMRRLRREWLLVPGEVFQQEQWTAAKNALLRDLLVLDFPAATIADSQARIDPAAASATLMVEIDSGPAFRFGELEIDGLERYSPAIIERANPIRPGERYSQQRLNELQERIQQTGYFRSAFATVEIDPAHAERAPIRVDVNELLRRQLALGGGISSDTGLRVQVRWLDRNFLERDWRLESELRLDRETRLGAADLFLRPFENGWQPSVYAHLARTTSAGETNDTIRTGARLTSPNRRDERAWTVALLADRQRVGDILANNRQALIGSFIYTRRRMENPLNPRRGYIASVELGVGPRGLVNEDNIARLLVRANAIYPIRENLRFFTRAQVGQVFGGSRLTVPGDLLFRTGGDQTVRGYGFQTLGVPVGGAVVAGNVMAVVSAELVYMFLPNWGGAVFMDAGNAADRWGDLRLARGTGVGVRWSSPLGQINADLAYGHETREPRFHFSIGYGF